MPTSSSTSLTLLEALANPADERAWEQFDRRYRPLLVDFARRLGLPAQGANEVAQRTAVAFFKSYERGNYDPARGRFKNWLLGIARHEMQDYCAERARQPVTPSQRSDLEARLTLIDDPHRLSSAWDDQWQQRVLTICLEQAAQRFSDRDLRIFTMLTAEAMSVSQVAGHMSLTESNVTTIKHRILAFMREARARIEHLG